MLRNFRNRIAIGAVVLLGVLALLQHWVATRRPLSPELRAAQEFQVTSTADRGTGSLREAIFAADSANQRARIIFRANRVVLQSPLPPLVNPLGIIVEAGGVMPEIDASGIGFGPVFDVSAPNSAISNIQVNNAPEQAVLVRAEGLRVLNLKTDNCDVGLYVAEGIKYLVIENSTFDRNRIGIWLATPGPEAIVRSNKFSANKEAAIWAVRRSELNFPQASKFEVKGNQFDGDRISLVLGNVPALIENNEFVKARDTAVYLLGQGAVVRENRIRNGAGTGVTADSTEGAVIENNEVDHNQALAILVRASRNALIQRNHVYKNGYGIAFVLGQRAGPNVAADNVLLSQQLDGIIVIGDSPILRGNRSANNTLAGLRILDFLPLDSGRVVSNPFLDNNTLAENKFNEPVRGEYRVTRPKKNP